jgi:hypothetical protein
MLKSGALGSDQRELCPKGNLGIERQFRHLTVNHVVGINVVTVHAAMPRHRLAVEFSGEVIC